MYLNHLNSYAAKFSTLAIWVHKTQVNKLKKGHKIFQNI